MHRLVLASAAAVMLALPGRAPAVDIQLPANVGGVQLLDHARVVTPIGSYPLPPLSDDPTVEGGSVRFFDMAPGGDDETYPLPAANWSMNSMTGEFEYDAAGPPTLALPCVRVDLHTNRVFVRCTGPGVTMTTPFAGDLGMILSIGDNTRYCAQLGGTTNQNSTVKLERVDAPAQGACPTPPTPGPELMPGKVTVIKADTFAKFVAKPPAGQTFDLPPAPVNPIPLGGSLRIRDTGGTGGDVTFALPAGAAWFQTAKSGYKYKGAGQPGDPCKVVLLKKRVIKGLCRGTDVDLDPALFTGDVAIRLTTGTSPTTKRWCAQFGGDDVSSATTLRRRNADAPAAVDCPSPSGAFLEETPTPFD